MGVLEVLLDIVVVVLTLVTTVKIITKAGYSGWWIMVPVSAVILSFASVIFGVNSLVTNATFALYRDFPDPVRQTGEERF